MTAERRRKDSSESSDSSETPAVQSPDEIKKEKQWVAERNAFFAKLSAASPRRILSQHVDKRVNFPKVENKTEKKLTIKDHLENAISQLKDSQHRYPLDQLLLALNATRKIQDDDLMALMVNFIGVVTNLNKLENINSNFIELEKITNQIENHKAYNNSCLAIIEETQILIKKLSPYFDYVTRKEKFELICNESFFKLAHEILDLFKEFSKEMILCKSSYKSLPYDSILDVIINRANNASLLFSRQSDFNRAFKSTLDILSMFVGEMKENVEYQLQTIEVAEKYLDKLKACQVRLNKFSEIINKKKEKAYDKFISNKKMKGEDDKTSKPSVLGDYVRVLVERQAQAAEFNKIHEAEIKIVKLKTEINKKEAQIAAAKKNESKKIDALQKEIQELKRKREEYKKFFTEKSADYPLLAEVLTNQKHEQPQYFKVQLKPEELELLKNFDLRELEPFDIVLRLWSDKEMTQVFDELRDELDQNNLEHKPEVKQLRI